MFHLSASALYYLGEMPIFYPNTPVGNDRLVRDTRSLSFGCLSVIVHHRIRAYDNGALWQYLLSWSRLTRPAFAGDLLAKAVSINMRSGRVRSRHDVRKRC